MPADRESPADLAKYGLSDARIVTWKSVPYKRMLEYLFYIHNPNIAEHVGSINDILERGFRNVEHYLVSDVITTDFDVITTDFDVITKAYVKLNL
jgi:hypothetical protein